MKPGEDLKRSIVLDAEFSVLDSVMVHVVDGMIGVRNPLGNALSLDKAHSIRSAIHEAVWNDAWYSVKYNIKTSLWGSVKARLIRFWDSIDESR